MPEGVDFRVWAPDRKQVDVLVGPEEDPVALIRGSGGYWSGLAPTARAGDLYRFRLDGTDAFPDPASRFQPQGPHKFSQVIDPAAFHWTDAGWNGIHRKQVVLYEMHVGTFTPEGTWRSAAEKLRYLADTGITMLEVMPVNEFPGRFGWGYDGVHPFAPTRLYGTPDDFRAFVDRAHSIGIGVILDVVYNHLGPDGNYLAQFSTHYFTERHQTDWGAAINFDSPDSQPVREFFIANAVHWIAEYHLDGLRLDATQNIYDNSKDHIIVAIARAVRDTAGQRELLLVAENEPQQIKLVRPRDQGGYGLDMLWNDDFHHSAMVAMTGHNEAYYSDHAGNPQEFVSAMKYGYLYQGQWYHWQKKPRGTSSLNVPRDTFITFLQNHDQVANSARGLRVHCLTEPGTYKAMTALFLLGTGTPMIFQGQEFAVDKPFFYFADHSAELAHLVHQGRIDFMSQFGSVATPEASACLPNPAAPSTFEQSKLDWADLQRHDALYRLHRDLLGLRRSMSHGHVDGAILSAHAFMLRLFGGLNGADHLLLVNLGIDLQLAPMPEPLLAPPEDCEWRLLWSSEDPKYGGCGTPPFTPGHWRLQGRSAVLMEPRPIRKSMERPDGKTVRPSKREEHP